MWWKWWQRFVFKEICQVIKSNTAGLFSWTTASHFYLSLRYIWELINTILTSVTMHPMLKHLKLWMSLLNFLKLMWTKFYKRSLTFWSQVGVPLCLNKIHPSSYNTDEWGTMRGGEEIHVKKGKNIKIILRLCTILLT